MFNLCCEAGLMGLLTMILGSLTFKIFLNKYNKYTVLNQKKKPIGIYVAFFVTGVVLFMTLEVLNLNKIYCDRVKCKNIRNLL